MVITATFGTGNGPISHFFPLSPKVHHNYSRPRAEIKADWAQNPKRTEQTDVKASSFANDAKSSFLTPAWRAI
jgi:hypothetical protein